MQEKGDENLFKIEIPREKYERLDAICQLADWRKWTLLLRQACNALLATFRVG
jgi:hypothetical protein